MLLEEYTFKPRTKKDLASRGVSDKEII